MTAKALVVLIALGASGVLVGCGGGPSESEYVEACLKQGTVGAEATCQCLAHEGKANLTSDGWAYIVFRAQGRIGEAQEVQSKMSPEEQAGLVSVYGQILGDCMPKSR